MFSLIHKCFLLLLISLMPALLKAQAVYKTPSGKKYHLASCRMVKNVSEEITVEKAVEIGLAPCLICNPPGPYGSTTQTKKAQGQNTTVQCSGITKTGTRCKHMTSIANGYCYQHQPG